MGQITQILGLLNMSSESELDKFFGPRPPAAIQERWILQPTFAAKTLGEETKSIFKEGQEQLFKRTHIPGFQTTITQIEAIYPWLLEKTEVLDKLLREKEYFDEADTSTTIGDALHRADILFNLITARVPGRMVVGALPNYKPAEIARYQEVLEEVELPFDAGREELEEVLIKAWERFHGLQGFLPLGQLPLTTGLRFIDPTTKEEVFYGEKVREMGILLAKAWAHQATQAEPISWEFRPDAVTQREAFRFSLKTGPSTRFM